MYWAMSRRVRVMSGFRMREAKKRVAVLVSGRGSNLQALLDACAQADYPAQVVAVGSNIPDAYGLTRAANAGVPTFTCSHKDYDGREAFEDALVAALMPYQPDLICLAGFMRILTPRFLNAFPNRVLNIHPSLLPKYKGLHTHQRAIEAGEREAGCTVHLVVPEMDAGPVVVQKRVPVLPGDDADKLAQRVLGVEHGAYVDAVQRVCDGTTNLDRLAETHL